MDVLDIALAQFKGRVFAGHTAGGLHGLCSTNPLAVEIAVDFLTPGQSSKPGVVNFYHPIYVDSDEFSQVEDNFYTGKFQTVMDMIHTGNDVSGTLEALDIAESEGWLDDVIGYCRKHGLPEDELQFILDLRQQL